MKATKYIKALALLTTFFAGVAMTSCEDEPDKYEIAEGLPTVHYVRLPDPEVADSLITGSYLSNTICIVGDNLRSVYELYFNDQKAILNTSLMTDHTIIVDVPSAIPSVVSNKMYLVNINKDTVAYDFNIQVPAPEITSMSNEYATPGTVVTINGNYFIDDPNVPLSITMGNVPVTEITSISQNAVSFMIPQGVSTGYINATSIYGTGKSTFRYMESNLLFDFDNDGDDALYNYNGDDSHFAFEYWPNGDNTTPYLNTLTDFEDLSNLQFKFEVNVPDAWSACAMQIMLTTNNEVSGSNQNNSFFQNETFPRALWIPWQSSGSYTTDGWTTVTIPLSEFRFGSSGTAINALSATDITGLTIFVYGGGATGTACTPTICIDNIRVVPIY